MEEVIQRSKMHKAMRQAQKVENEEVVDELDKDVDAVMGILMQESERAERVRLFGEEASCCKLNDKHCSYVPPFSLCAFTFLQYFCPFGQSGATYTSDAGGRVR